MGSCRVAHCSTLTNPPSSAQYWAFAPRHQRSAGSASACLIRRSRTPRHGNSYRNCNYRCPRTRWLAVRRAGRRAAGFNAGTARTIEQRQLRRRLLPHERERTNHRSIRLGRPPPANPAPASRPAKHKVTGKCADACRRLRPLHRSLEAAPDTLCFAWDR